MNSLSRRDFFSTSLLGTGALLSATELRNDKLDVGFFLVGDTHYLADKDDPTKLESRSAPTNARLLDQLNRLSGTKIPDTAGGGTVESVQGVIHAGDLIDTGDKNGAGPTKMQDTEWASFVEGFGLTGKDGKLKLPVYEVYGNHDSPAGDGLVVKKIIERNKKRPGVANASPNGLHYSWDWGPVHFVNLGIVVGSVEEVKRKRRYNPLDSLAFLIADLKEKVGTSGRPVVITHHVDVARYSTDPDPKNTTASNKEWDPADVKGYHDALKTYNVVAILYGHTHVRNIYRWDGSPKKANEGISVFNVDNSAHFNSKEQAFFYFHLRDGEMIVREFATTDRWETGNWTAQVWKSAITVKKS